MPKAGLPIYRFSACSRISGDSCGRQPRWPLVSVSTQSQIKHPRSISLVTLITVRVSGVELVTTNHQRNILKYLDKYNTMHKNTRYTTNKHVLTRKCWLWLGIETRSNPWPRRRYYSLTTETSDLSYFFRYESYIMYIDKLILQRKTLSNYQI